MKRGFTVIELMIAVAIIGILLAIAIPLFQGKKLNPSNYSMGATGLVETRCVGGYQFVIGHNGSPTQILDDRGHGVPCRN